MILRLAALFLFTGPLMACVSGRPAGDGYLEGIRDPDPDEDSRSGQPQFCNVTGKTGADREACVAHNRSLYQSFNDEAKKREPWFNFAPDGWAQSPEVPDDKVLAVVKETEAVQKLDQVPFVELKPADVTHYTGKGAQFPGLKPYLVRALVYFKNTGTFHVYQKDQAILVQHDSLGPDAPPEQRSAVVVFLASAPQNVYVDCGLLE